MTIKNEKLETSWLRLVEAKPINEAIVILAKVLDEIEMYITTKFHSFEVEMDNIRRTLDKFGMILD